MGIFDKVKNAFSMSEEEYFDDVDVEEEAADYGYQKSAPSRRQKNYDQQSDNVVDMSSSFAKRQEAEPRTHVVVKNVNSFNEVSEVLDVLLEQRIVILNLETCADDDLRRILDVISGINYATQGTIQRIANRTYIITPNNVPLTGELLDEVATSAVQNKIF